MFSGALIGALFVVHQVKPLVLLIAVLLLAPVAVGRWCAVPVAAGLGGRGLSRSAVGPSQWAVAGPVHSGWPATPENIRRHPVKIVVDYDECASNAVCMGIAPEVFEVRDDGFLYVLNEHPGEELREKVRQAANGCPTGAITIVEDE